MRLHVAAFGSLSVAVDSRMRFAAVGAFCATPGRRGEALVLRAGESFVAGRAMPIREVQR